MAQRICSAEWCDTVLRPRQRKHCDECRLWVNVITTASCWYWTGCTVGGYGVIRIGGSTRHGGKNYYTHRVAWQILVGEIPDDKEIDHRCRNKICVNPDHLEVVTDQVNTLRGYNPASSNAKKTHCPKGHPYDEENTGKFTTKGSNPRRYCRTCQKERLRKRRLAKKRVSANETK